MKLNFVLATVVLILLAGCATLRPLPVSHIPAPNLRTPYVASATGSMLPMIQPGDWLQVKQVSYRSLRAGQVALFRWQGLLVTHRLVSKTRFGWITRGIHNARIDASYLTEKDFLGIVTEVYR